ncbi:hypothetical protein BC826DRAFT_1185426 [Russula brevipes]|nr:hypothetical protein BC826DRAFT_1185426 [Russula brevipes]
MVNFHDPAVVAQDYITVVKLWHTLDGVYLWEFFTTLDYEWEVIRGRRPYRWTIWIYSLTRVAALMSVILNVVGMDVTTSMNCQLWISFELVFCYSSGAAASLLIVLRIIAIWKRHKFVMATAFGLLGINVASFIQSVSLLLAQPADDLDSKINGFWRQVRSKWAPTDFTCASANTEINSPNLIVTLVTDVSLLLMMLVGLLRIRDGSTFGLTHFLWKQGLMWLLLAVVAEVPPVVFIVLNLNDPFNIMFEAPSLIIIAIAGTRMHRSLVDFATSYPDITHENFEVGGFTTFKTARTDATPTPPNQMQTVMYAVSGRHPTRQIRDGESRISINKQTQENLFGH